METLHASSLGEAADMSMPPAPRPRRSAARPERSKLKAAESRPPQRRAQSSSPWCRRSSGGRHALHPTKPNRRLGPQPKWAPGVPGCQQYVPALDVDVRARQAGWFEHDQASVGPGSGGSPPLPRLWHRMNRVHDHRHTDEQVRDSELMDHCVTLRADQEPRPLQSRLDSVHPEVTGTESARQPTRQRGLSRPGPPHTTTARFLAVDGTAVTRAP